MMRASYQRGNKALTTHHFTVALTHLCVKEFAILPKNIRFQLLVVLQ